MHLIRNRASFFLCLLLILLLGCTGMKFGSDALPLMEAEELRTLEVLRSYGPQTTEADVSRDFGRPVKGAGSKRPVWELSFGTRKTRIYAYFLGGGLAKIHYFSINPRWGHVLHYREDGTPAELNN